jgi:ATP-dependent DNA helicase RecQ
MGDDRERALAVDKLNRMAAFASRNQCRRRQLLAYFEEEYPDANCASCDICTGRAATADATREAQMLISAVVRTGERFGAGHVVDVLVGADTQKIRDLGHHQIKTFGVGKHRDKPWWRSLVGEMLARGILALDDGPYPVIKITDACLPILHGKENLEILELGRKEPARTRAGGDGSISAETGGDPELFNRLKTLRKTMAQRQGVPPYMVFSDKTLHDMCRRKPETKAAFREISGVGDAKLDKYGAEFVQEIREHLGSRRGPCKDQVKPAFGRTS